MSHDLTGALRHRTTSLIVRTAACAAVSITFANMAYAIGGAGAAATANFPYAGRVQNETTPLNNHSCSGSYIRQSVVMSASHCVNEDTMSNVIQRFERFQPVGGNQFFALGVQEPRYDASAAISDHDISLLLILNGPGAPGGGFPTLASAADAVLAAADNVEIVGFTGSAAGGNPLLGTMKINAAGDVTANRYKYTANPNFTQGGDSGGPHIFDYGAGGGGKKIVSTTQGGDAASITNAIRVDVHRPFIDGDGQGGQRALDRLGGVGNTNWSTAASWMRTSANNNAVPAASDVVVLDPTTATNTATVVTLDVDSPLLDGLLNDVTLKVTTKHLHVTVATGTTGNSGVLNGGIIDVGGDAGGGSGTFTISRSLDNASVAADKPGTINIRKNGLMQIGSGLAAGTENAVWNNANSVVNVLSGGRLNVTNTNLSANFNNRASATFNVSGGADGNGTASLDGLVNLGTVEVNKGGRLIASRTPGAGLRLALDNQANASLKINPGGNVTSRGRARNTGTTRIESNAGDGVGIYFAFNDTAGAKGRFDNAGKLNFVNSGGTTAPQLVTQDADFLGVGEITGEGSFVMTADSNHDLRATLASAPGIDLNDIDITWDSAFTSGGGEVTMETLSINDGPNVAELGGPFALEHFCVIGSSKVKLVDSFNNEGAGVTEALYTEYLGVSAGSTLNLAGLTLYYQHLDLHCGGLSGTVLLNGGMLIQIPEPATSAILLLASGMLIARRRRC